MLEIYGIERYFSADNVTTIESILDNLYSEYKSSDDKQDTHYYIPDMDRDEVYVRSTEAANKEGIVTRIFDLHVSILAYDKGTIITLHKSA